MMKKILLPLTTLAIFLLAGCNVAPNPVAPEGEAPPPQTSRETTASITVTGDEDENAMMEEEAEDVMEPDDREMMEEGSEPQYIAYSATERSQLHGSEPYVIFFHATWCPICRALEADILENFDSFPAGTKILKADYDTENALKDEYDIKIQSTVVVVDGDGEVVWQGQDPSIEDLKGFITDSLG